MTYSRTNPNADAFPSDSECGLTKREFFAAMAMQGCVAIPTDNWYSSPQGAAKLAVEAADALIAALNKEPPCSPE